MGRVFNRFPSTGKPGGAASKHLRVDFNPDTVFDSLIETKTPRLGWARATPCPCRGYNGQTDQLDPACTSCNGLGWTYFRPSDYVVNTEELGSFTDEQKAVLDKANAVAIRGLITGLESEPDMFRALGHWAFGSARFTTRGANRLGYYDRIIQIDELMVYAEYHDVDASGTVKTKYLVHSLNDVRSTSTVYGENDIKLVNGVLTWKANKAPAAGTRVAVNYLCHPHWVVVQHTHLTRSSLTRFRRPVSTLETPEGNTSVLPSSALLRLEHLDLSPKE